MTRREVLLAMWLGATSLFAATGSCVAEEPDWSDYAHLLERYVSGQEKDNVVLNSVEYSKIRHDPLFGAVVERLETFPLDRLATRQERLAFYINAYNILTIKMVLDHWPLASIKDAAGVFQLVRPVWTMEAGRLGGKAVTLEQIEHRILRPMGEPRMHLAIVCASVSCPDLRTEPYTAARLNGQLDDQVRRFFANPAKGLEVKDGELRTSKIFSWFKEDFDGLGGVDAFIRRYAKLPPGTTPGPSLPYNWNLNGG